MRTGMVEIAVQQQKEPVKDLSIREVKRLEQLENIVVENFKTFLQVGKALAEIRERKLYRNKAVTFEKYCKELFDIAKSRAYQLMDAAEAMENLHNCGSFEEDHVLLPFNEAQVRPLIKLRPDQQKEAWKAALQSAPNGKITASHVNKVVKKYLGEKVKTTVRQAQEKVAQKASPEFLEAFESISQQIIKERNSGYKYTSRGEIVKALDQLRAEIAEDGESIEDSVFHGSSDDMNKLEQAGFKLFRMDRTRKTITVRNIETGGWNKHDGPFETLKEMEVQFRSILQDDMHLRG